jgi:hypothetical protein
MVSASLFAAWVPIDFRTTILAVDPGKFKKMMALRPESPD